MPTSPWIAEGKPVPPGTYVGVFKGVDEIVTPWGTPGWRWSWKVNSKLVAGTVEAYALTEQGLRAGSLASQLTEGLLDRPPSAGEDVQGAVELCKGKAYFVIVEGGPRGGKPGVRSVKRVPTKERYLDERPPEVEDLAILIELTSSHYSAVRIIQARLRAADQSINAAIERLLNTERIEKTSEDPLRVAITEEGRRWLSEEFVKGLEQSWLR